MTHAEDLPEIPPLEVRTALRADYGTKVPFRAGVKREFTGFRLAANPQKQGGNEGEGGGPAPAHQPVEWVVPRGSL